MILPPSRHSEAGLTLTEVMVAMMIFATIGTIGTGLLTSALTARDIQAETTDQVTSIQRVRTLFRDDISQLVMRPSRSDEGLVNPLVFSGNADGADSYGRMSSNNEREVLVLTRRGWDNPGHVRPRSSLQRVSWLYDGATLKRRVWSYPDTTSDTQSSTMTILTDIEDLELEFLSGRGWTNDARVIATENQTSYQGPGAVRLRYTLAGLGEMEHVVLTPFMEADS